MSTDLCKNTWAEDIEIGDELNLDGDEYGDNEQAIFGYAVVERKTEWWDGSTGFPWITLTTSQGEFEVPSSHVFKVKIEE